MTLFGARFSPTRHPFVTFGWEGIGKKVMKSDTLFNSEVIEIPDDLRFICPEEKLLQFVYEAQHSTSWPASNLTLRNVFDPTPAPVLRSLLIYSLGIGVYSARDIEIGVLQESNLRYLAANHSPLSSTIHSYRRNHSIPIRAALNKLLELALSVEESGDGISAEQLAREAQRRFLRATQADSMALDE